MTEEIGSEIIRKTQDSLGKYIKRPPLTEKLLRKPPFRYLHDIITNVINETGFLKGLYDNNEMHSENIKDRDTKIAYLQKLIEALRITTDERITARPSKIIAGLEPIKTNQLLQIIGNAIEKQLGSTQAVQQMGMIAISERKSNTKSKTDNKTKLKRSPKEEPKKLVRKNTAEKINVMKKKPSPRIETEDKKNPVPPSEKQANDKICRKDDNNDRENHIEKEVTGEKASMALPISASTESEETHTPDTEARGELHTQVIIPDGGPGAHELQKEVTVVHKQSARLRPPSVRPSSARPAAPRLRDKVDTVVPPEQLVPLGKVHVIVEHAVSDNEDNEETVRLEMPVEDVVQLAETSSIPVERGHLVQQILAQIGEPIDTPVSTAVPCVEDHRLVQSIQTVTRAANPLGKLVSYVHEDVDSMLGELRTWSAVNRRLREELQHERQRDHDASRPLLQQLQRLDADLVRHRHLIHTAQASVIRNQHKIKLLLTPTQ